MSQRHRNSIAENEESIEEAPAPHLIGHRKKFDAFERDITGGHLPVYVVEIEGTPSGAIWWLRTTKDAMEIKSFKSLLRALNSNCWAHPRPEPVKDAVISPPAIAQIAAETREPPAAEGAISTVPPPASLETHSKSKAKDNAVPAPMPLVEKPPPAKRRRTYVPNDTMRTTRARPNPASR